MKEILFETSSALIVVPSICDVNFMLSQSHDLTFFIDFPPKYSFMSFVQEMKEHKATKMTVVGHQVYSQQCLLGGTPWDLEKKELSYCTIILLVE